MIKRDRKPAEPVEQVSGKRNTVAICLSEGADEDQAEALQPPEGGGLP